MEKSTLVSKTLNAKTSFVSKQSIILIAIIISCSNLFGQPLKVQNYGTGEDGVEIGSTSYTWLGIGLPANPWALEEAGGDFNLWRRWSSSNCCLWGNYYIGIKPQGLVYLGNVLNSSYRLNIDKGTYTYGIYTNGDIRTTTKVYANGVLLTSDLRKKKNISSIQNTQIEKLKSLNGVNYEIIEDYDTASLYIPAGLAPNSNKYKQLVEESNRLKSEKLAAKQNISKQSDLQMGFIAQDLQKIFPELVKKDENGFLAVNYISIIPLLVEAYKAQQTVIEDIQLKIRNIESRQNNTENSNIIPNGMTSETPVLYQNAPNPFFESTTISCYIPQNCNKVQLCIYNLQGLQLKCFELSAKGNVSTIIQGRDLPSGVYAYILICDGKASETKQMILTK